MSKGEAAGGVLCGAHPAELTARSPRRKEGDYVLE